MNIAYALCIPGLFAIRRPIIASISLILVLLICLFLTTRLSFESDISKSFSSDSPYYRNYSDLISALGFVPKQIVVLAESSKPFDLVDYEALRDMAFEFELANSVSSVFSVASVRFPKNHDKFPDESLLPAELNAGEINDRLDALLAVGLRTPVAVDRQSALFVVSLTGGINDDTFLATLGELKEASNINSGRNLRYTFTGEDLVGPEIVKAIQHDLIVNNLIGSLIASVFALFLFGNIRLVLIAVLPAFAAALIALSTFTLLDIPLTVVNTVIPILTLILALADSVHLTLHFRDDNPGLPVRQRIESAIITIGPACALTAVTTAIAFAAIGTSDNPQLRDLAIVGTVSVSLSYVSVIVAFASLGRWLGTDEQQSSKPERFVIPYHWSDWIFRNCKHIGVSCAVIFCITTIGLSSLFPWYNLDQNLPTDSVVRMANKKISDEFGGIYRIWSELDTTGENALDTEKGWSRLVALTRALEAAAPGYPVVSLATLSRWQGQPDKMPTTELLQSVPEEFGTQLVSEDGSVARVITIAPEAMLDRQAYETQNRIEESAASAGATRSIGLPLVMAHGSVSVILQLCIGLGTACFISVVLVAAFFKWPMLAVALVIPNALPLAVAAASLALTHGGELTPTAMLGLTVAFGIAIDDSIHLVNRFLAETNSGKGVEQAVRIAVQETGKAMFVTTLLICSGMLVTMFSAFETIRLFGGILIMTFITAFLADILLLPCLLRALSAKP